MDALEHQAIDERISLARLLKTRVYEDNQYRLPDAQTSTNESDLVAT
jgi:hypothetical protein